MKNIINCIGIVLLLASCNQEIDSKDKDQQEESINNSITDATNQAIEQDALEVELSKDYKKKLNQLKTDYKKNLDTGIEMLHTSKTYNKMMDSLMTLVYTDVLEKISETDKKHMILDQKKWLEKRENKFNIQYKKGEEIFNETGIFPELEEMVAYGITADLNYERAISLHKKLISIK